VAEEMKVASMEHGGPPGFEAGMDAGRGSGSSTTAHRRQRLRRSTHHPLLPTTTNRGRAPSRCEGICSASTPLRFPPTPPPCRPLIRLRVVARARAVARWHPASPEQIQEAEEDPRMERDPGLLLAPFAPRSGVARQLLQLHTGERGSTGGAAHR
jgi:hypothetical protein